MFTIYVASWVFRDGWTLNIRPPSPLTIPILYIFDLYVHTHPHVCARFLFVFSVPSLTLWFRHTTVTSIRPVRPEGLFYRELKLRPSLLLLDSLLERYVFLRVYVSGLSLVQTTWLRRRPTHPHYIFFYFSRTLPLRPVSRGPSGYTGVDENELLFGDLLNSCPDCTRVSTKLS